MKILINFLLIYTTLTICSNSSYAQTPIFEWVKGVGGNNYDEAKSIATDQSGNVYTTGYYSGTVDFNSGVGVFNLTSAGVQSAYILKLDLNGNFLWAKDISCSFISDAQGIKIDGNGNIYVIGNFNGTIDLDPGIGINSVISSTSEVFVLKLNSSGNYVWAKTIDGNIGNAGYAIEVDISGNVYLSGGFQGSTDFDPSAAIFNLISSGNQDIFILKLDSNGAFLWAKKMGSGGNDYSKSIALDNLGNVYTTGQFSTNVDFDPGVGVTMLNTFGGNDIFISKLSTTGNFIWAKQVGGSGSETSNSVLIDAAGNVYVTGSFGSSNVDFNPGSGTFTMSANFTDGYLLKLNSGGNFLWAKHLSSGGKGNDLAVDSSDNIYIITDFNSTTNTDASAAGFSLTAIGNYDAIIFKLSSAGVFVWGKQFGGTLLDYGNGITVDMFNNVNSCGTFQGTTDFNIGAAPANLTETGASGYDIFIHKLIQCETPSAPVDATNAANLSICPNSATTLSVTSSETVNWYETASSTVILGTGLSFITPDLTVGTYTYYAEASGCAITASRTAITVSVGDNIPPVAPVLANLTSECSVTPTVPTTTDNCTGIITATTSTVFPITSEGTTVVSWTFDDGNGNAVSVNQNVVIEDLTSPVPDDFDLPVISDYCAINSLTQPSATDNCNATVLVTNDAILPITSSGTTIVTWTYDDQHGNTSTQTQTVIISPINPTISESNNVLSANIGDSYQWINCATSQPISGATNQTYLPTMNGNYAVISTIGNCSETSDCYTINWLGTNELSSMSNVKVYPNPTNGSFNIELNETSDVLITNCLGQKVSEYKNENGTLNIRLEHLNKGIYFVSINEETIKITIE